MQYRLIEQQFKILKILFSMRLICLVFLMFFAFTNSFNVLAQQECFVGEVRLFAGNFAPRGWQYCEGQLVSISENTALFSILGTTYGGDGRNTFMLPNLKGPVSSTGAASRGNKEVAKKSIPGGKSVKVKFVNKTNQEVSAFWLDWNGKPTYYGSIQPGKTWEIASGLKQVWAFTHGKKEVCHIKLEEGKSTYNVQPSHNSSSSSSVSGTQLQYIICTQGSYPSRY